MATKQVYAWRCGCSKTTQAIEYANNKLKKSSNKVVYAVPTIQMEKEVKRKLDGLVINSKSKTDLAIKSKIFRTEGDSGWSLIEKRNELLKTEKCLIVTHARLITTDPLDFYDTRFLRGSKDIIIDEFAMKLRKFYIQKATLLAYITHPYYKIPKYVTYEDRYDDKHKRRDSFWQAWNDDMYEDPYKRLHKIRISKGLLKNELLEMFPLWMQNFIDLCKKDKIWLKTLDIYQKLCLTFRRTHVSKADKRAKVTDYTRWLWLSPKELTDNGIDLSDIIGASFSMLDNASYDWDSKISSKLRRIYDVFNYQKTVSYVMLLIARQIVLDQYFDTDFNDSHKGYYLGGINPLERWFIQNTFNVTCLDGSATIFRDIYKHYNFEMIDDEEKSIEHYADNLDCNIFNFRSFSQTKIQNMPLRDLAEAFLRYIWPYDNRAKCWYVIVPSKCTDNVVKALSAIYGKDKVCNCTTAYRNYIDEEGIGRQVSIISAIKQKPNAKFIVANYDGQLGSNEFARRCDGIIAISQLNFPKNINRMYSDYYKIANYNDLYSAHCIYQESARPSNRLMKAINYKKGHKVPFVALLGMDIDQFKTFNRLNTTTKLFDKNESFNLKRLIL